MPCVSCAQAKDGAIKQHQSEVDQLNEKEKVLRQEDAELKRVKVDWVQGGISYICMYIRA